MSSALSLSTIMRLLHLDIALRPLKLIRHHPLDEIDHSLDLGSDLIMGVLNGCTLSMLNPLNILWTQADWWINIPQSRCSSSKPRNRVSQDLSSQIRISNT